MTRRPSSRQSVIAARSSFWETLPQVCCALACLDSIVGYASALAVSFQQEGAASPDVRRTVSDSEPVTPGLYDQLVHLKDWIEETAELCSVAEDKYAVTYSLW